MQVDVALVLWHGGIGGAEVLSMELAVALQRLGVNVEVIFITSTGPLADRLDEVGIPARALTFDRGTHVLRHPRRFAAGVAASGAHGVVLPECGFFGAALRLGGYRGRIVAVEHGSLLEPSRSLAHRAFRWMSRTAGARAEDAEIAVSDFMLGELAQAPHPRRIERIYNGLDPARFAAEPARQGSGDELVLGFAGRLIPGKGTEDAIRAAVQAAAAVPVRLRIAGDGPQRVSLEALTRELRAEMVVEFTGMVSDISAFWSTCDVAIFPSRELAESFGMSALEAMACARPVIATRRGALPELVRDGETGRVIPPGDVAALSEAIVAYATAPGLRVRHGESGRRRVEEHFHIDDCARAYLACLDGRL